MYRLSGSSDTNKNKPQVSEKKRETQREIYSNFKVLKKSDKQRETQKTDREADPKRERDTHTHIMNNE